MGSRNFGQKEKRKEREREPGKLLKGAFFVGFKENLFKHLKPKKKLFDEQEKNFNFKLICFSLPNSPLSFFHFKKLFPLLFQFFLDNKKKE